MNVTVAAMFHVKHMVTGNERERAAGGPWAARARDRSPLPGEEGGEYGGGPYYRRFTVCGGGRGAAVVRGSRRAFGAPHHEAERTNAARWPCSALKNRLALFRIQKTR